MQSTLLYNSDMETRIVENKEDVVASLQSKERDNAIEEVVATIAVTMVTSTVPATTITTSVAVTTATVDKETVNSTKKEVKAD